ncbi:MAG: GNAT family N-acetyltransferase [Alphaproteobacteria bacterium]
MTLTIRNVTEADKAWMHALNVDCLPAVNDLSEDRLWALVARTYATRVALLDGVPMGVATLLAPGIDHDSMNYQWFDRRMDDFLYLDRIMVSARARGKGIGQALYQDVFQIAAREPAAAAVTCEVNLRPFNGGSIRFHANLGFFVVGEQETEGGKKAVTLLRRSVMD